MRDSIFVDREPWRGGFSVGGDSLSQGVRSEMHITPRRRIVQWRDTAAFESLLRATLRGGFPVPFLVEGWDWSTSACPGVTYP